MKIEMRYIFNQARKLRKECGYKYVWFANNKVYIKKNEEDKPQIVKSPQHNAHLLSVNQKSQAYTEEAVNLKLIISLIF
jgi:hypothetical protein